MDQSAGVHFEPQWRHIIFGEVISTAQRFQIEYPRSMTVAHPCVRLPKNGFDVGSRARHCRSATSSEPGAVTRQLALIVEVDGILFDMHMDGHRVAFNKAFADLGLDCANWSLPVYHDLLSRADGSGERMVATFFEMTGWPMVVQTNDKGAFAAKVVCSTNMYQLFSGMCLSAQASAAVTASHEPQSYSNTPVDGSSATCNSLPSIAGLPISSIVQPPGQAAAQPLTAIPTPPYAQTITRSVEGDLRMTHSSEGETSAAATEHLLQGQPASPASASDAWGGNCTRKLLPNERLQLVQQVLELKAKMLRRMLENDQVPLRRGIVGILDDALAAGANVAALAGTLSDPDDDAASSALRLLEPERSDLVKVFSAPTIRQRRGSESEEAGAGPSNLAGRMASAANELRQREALNFVQALAGDGKDGVQVALAPELLGASTDAVSSQWLAALAALMGTPASNCVVLGSSTPVIRAAAGAGMVPVAVPRQMAARAIYPGARAKFDSLGPGSATWSKLKSLLPQQ